MIATGHSHWQADFSTSVGSRPAILLHVDVVAITSLHVWKSLHLYNTVGTSAFLNAIQYKGLQRLQC